MRREGGVTSSVGDWGRCLKLPIRDGRDFITTEFAEPTSVVSSLIANTCRVLNHEISWPLCLMLVMVHIVT
jgi:hypothetical protein